MVDYGIGCGASVQSIFYYRNIEFIQWRVIGIEGVGAAAGARVGAIM